MEDADPFVLGVDGIINDDMCMIALKVLCLDKSEFSDYKEKEGWSEAESDSSTSGESKLSLDKISSLNASHKQLLKRMAEIHLSKLSGEDLTTDEVNKRQRFSQLIVHGQKQLLKNLIMA